MSTGFQVKVLFRHQGKYLLLKKIKDIHPDHDGGWEVSGGKIEGEEGPAATCYREVKEETGLLFSNLVELEPLQIEKGGVRSHTHVYVAEVDHFDVRLSPEHSEFVWVRPNEVDILENVIFKKLLVQYMAAAEAI
jgi:8-oxo-dGTP pyrophosphatase MutT (NUDIX family)